MVKMLAQGLHKLHGERTRRASCIGDEFRLVARFKLAREAGKELVVLLAGIGLGLSVKAQVVMHLRQGIRAAELEKSGIARLLPGREVPADSVECFGLGDEQRKGRLVEFHVVEDVPYAVGRVVVVDECEEQYVSSYKGRLIQSGSTIEFIPIIAGSMSQHTKSTAGRSNEEKTLSVMLVKFTAQLTNRRIGMERIQYVARISAAQR